MDLPQDFLSTIAEMALALIGFSGVVTVLGHRAGSTWSAEEKLQLRTLVEPAACAMFGALLPATIALAVSDQEILWRLSNAILALLMTLAFTAFLLRARTAKLTLLQKVLTVVSAIVLILIILSAANVLANHQLTFYIGLLLALIIGVHNFALLLFNVETKS